MSSRTLGDLTQTELAMLVREELLAGQLMDRAGMPHIIDGYGRDEMAAIAIDEWMGASPVYTARMQRLLGFGAGDVETIFKGMQFDIGAPPEFMDFRYRVTDARHGEFWLDHCGALVDVEPMGEDFVHAMCHTIEDPTFDATAIATNRRAQVRPIHRPPRDPGDRHPHCHWSVTIDEAHPELPLPDQMVPVAATVLAGLDLGPIGAGATDADMADGCNDYTAPLDPDLRLERFSTAALRSLAEEVCVQQHLLVMSFGLAIERRHGTEAATAILDRQFTGIAGLTSGRLREALGLGSDLAAVATVLRLHPAFRPREYVDWRVTLDESGDGSSIGDPVGPNRSLTVELGDCPALRERGVDSWITRLADGHDDGLAAAVEGVTPFARLERTGDRRWRVTLADEPAPERPEVALTRFSTGADWEFRSPVDTPVTLKLRTTGPATNSAAERAVVAWEHVAR